MRVRLPQIRSNGHAAAPERVFIITGLCQDPRFRLGQVGGDDFCLVSMGTPGGAAVPPGVAGTDGDPYFVVRRSFDDGAAVVAVRVDWEGIFTLLANDDEQAEGVYSELISPASPEDVNRQWSEEASTLAMFAELLHLA